MPQTSNGRLTKVVTGAVVLAGLALMTTLLLLRDDGERENGDLHVLKLTPPRRNPNPPAAEQRAENERRLERIAAIEEAGATTDDVPELMDYFLRPAAEAPPPGIEVLPEGYASARAADLLERMGEKAWPALLEAMSNDEYRGRAFIILANQGVKEAFDKAFELPNAGGLSSTMVIYLSWGRPVDVERMGKWYKANREKLVFNRKMGVFDLEGVADIPSGRGPEVDMELLIRQEEETD
jgi:hypothetical protein